MRQTSLIFSAIFGALVFATTAFAAEPLLPHRAVYSLSLAKGSPSGGIAGANGDMLFDLKADCEGWTFISQLRFQLLMEDGSTIRYGTSLEGWEATDGSRYRFHVRQYGPYGLESENQGEARMPPAGGDGTVRYSEPDPRSILLSAGTVFPTAVTAITIAKAQEGGQLFWAPIFDGTEDQDLYDLSVSIGAQKDGQNERLAALAGHLSWPIGLAYYSRASQEMLPDYQTEFRLYDNGVVDNQIFYLDDFALRALLTDLTPYASPDC